MQRLSRNGPKFAWILVASSALAGSASAARPVPEARLALESFATLDAALVAATRGVHERSVREDREHLGGIFASGDRARFRYSVAAGSRGADELSARLRAPAGFQLAAIWHNHGAPGTGRSLFSDRDTALSRRLGVPIYLATPAGALRVFEPGARTLSPAQASRRGVGWRAGTALGSAVDSPGTSATACRIAARGRSSVFVI